MGKELGGKNDDLIIPGGTGPTAVGWMPFGGVINAISRIQQYAVIEKTGQDIPSDFLTLRGKLSFFSVGFGNGFVEGLIFALLAVALIPMRDHLARMSLFFGSNGFIWTVNCLPVIIMAGLCCYMGRYRFGSITRSAVDNLLVGRLLSLMTKGVLIFILLSLLANRTTPNTAWRLSRAVTFGNVKWADKIHGVLSKSSIFGAVLDAKSDLRRAAWQILCIFLLAAMTPFLTV